MKLFIVLVKPCNNLYIFNVIINYLHPLQIKTSSRTRREDVFICSLTSIYILLKEEKIAIP